MILLAMVSTFLLLHLHFIPDNVLVSGGITLALLIGAQALNDNVDLTDKIRKSDKFLDEY